MRKRRIVSFISATSRAKACSKEAGISLLALLPLFILGVVGYQLALPALSPTFGRITGYPVASAASPQTGFPLQASGDVTKTGKDITTQSYTVTLPGRRIQWVISAGNSTGQIIPQYTIVDPIRDGQRFVVGSLQTPPGWTKERSNDNGTSWGYTPVAGADGTDPAVTHIRSVGTSIPSPSTGVTGTIGSLSLPAQLVSGGGDGWRPIFNRERSRIYMVNHHEIPRVIDGSNFGAVVKCIDTATNAQCAGFPRYLDGGSGYTIGTTHNPYEWVDAATNRFYFFGYSTAEGRNSQWGVACFDMATNNSCGFSPVAGLATLGSLAATYDGFTMLPGEDKFYIFNTAGQAVCVNWPALTGCGALGNLFSNDGYDGTDATVATVIDQTANRLYAVRSYYNISNETVQAKLACIELTSGLPCAGIPEGGKLVLRGNAAPRWGGKAHPWFWQNAQGANQSICIVSNSLMGSVPGAAPGIACYDLAGFNYTGQPAGLINYAALNVPSGYTISFTQGRNFGSRLYQPAWIANDQTSQWFRDSRDICYDFSTQSPCADWNGGTGQPLDWQFGEPAGYEYVAAGNCIYGFGHNGILWSFDQDGTTPCRAEQTTQLTANPAPYYCDGLSLADHNVSWGTVRLLSPQPAGMTRLTADVYDGATGQLLIDDGNMLAGGGLSLAGVNFAQHPALRVIIQGAGSWANSLSVGVFWQGDAPQICFQTLIPQGYTYTVVTNTVYPPGDPPVTYTLSIPRLAISKAVDKALAKPGDVLTYTLVVTNTSGPKVRLDPVRVSDPNPVAGATLVAGSVIVEPASRVLTVGSSLPELATLNLGEGEAARITFQLRLPTSGLTHNQLITNTATATPPSWTNLPPVSDNAVTRITLPTDLTGSEKQVSGHSGPGNTTQRGDVLTYTIRLLNNTPTAATNVVVSDTLDSNLTNLRQVSNGGEYNTPTRTITWAGLTVPGAVGTRPGELVLSYLVDVAASAEDGAIVRNRANVLYDGRQLELDAPDLVVKAKPKLAVGKTVAGQSGPGNQTKPGDILTYTIAITNSETVTATGVSVTDPLDPALEVPPLAISNSGSYNSTERKIEWSNLSVPAAISGTNALTPGALSLSFIVRVPLTTPDGTRINNVATVTSTDQPPLEARAPELIVKIPGLSTPTKNVSGQAGPGYTAKPGDVITYSISLFNPGNLIASGITVTDELDSALENPSDISNGGSYNAGTRTITWLNLSVPAAKSASEPGKLVISFRAKVKQTSPAGTKVNNTAVVVTPPGTGGGGTAKAPELTVTKPDLSPSGKGVSGQSGPGNNTKVGDTVTYAITTTNSGSREATGVVVSDTLVAYLEDPTEISDGGQFNPTTRTITWSSLAVAVGQSKVVTFKTKIRNLTGNSSGVGVVTNTVVIVPPGWTGDPPVKRDAPELVLGKPDLSGSTKGVSLGSGNNLTVMPGQGYTYTITVKNSGNATASGVTVTDKLDTTLLLLDDPQAGNPIGQNGSYDAATSTLTWVNLTVPAGGSVELTVRVKVRLTAAGGAKINNTAVCSVPVEGGNGCNPVAPPVLVDKPGVVLTSVQTAPTPTPPPLPAQTGPDGKPLVASEDLKFQPTSESSNVGGWWLFFALALAISGVVGLGLTGWLWLRRSRSKLKLES